MHEIPYGLPLGFFFIALFYSMVGFGGGSSYLAVLALAGLPYQSIAPLALGCNLVVSGGGAWHFYRAGQLGLKNVLPLMVSSIPMAYVGGRILIPKELFCFLLGLSLLAAAFRMFLPEQVFEKEKDIAWEEAWKIGLPLGALLGFLAGLVGIGGGIFLVPLLLLMRWVNLKEAAAASSFFIMVNSASGLLGQLHKAAFDFNYFLPLGLAVLVGGQIGSRLGAYHVPKVRLQQGMAVFILCVAIKLMWEAIAWLA